MRLAAYAGASTLLAAGIVLRAFHERPNFYSACVYLAQSSACRMILLNLLLLSAYGVVRTLQKLLYGPLRAIEREQLWDKAWYAVTETALAMTTFRDEVGAWFFVMFICLLAGKIWGWISEARVDALEQQPPTNPRLYHLRLTISLLLSEVFDGLMLRYCIMYLIEQPKPGMMVMFAFEFAVLSITSTSTALKYVLAIQEKLVIKRQVKAKVEERRLEIRAAREEAQRQATSAGDTEVNAQEVDTNVEAEENIDENEIDVPGWQEKGRWVLGLDLLTDLLKLLVYMCFFTILLMFHGIPIHIIRDVFLTTRSFLKRISDFLKYRNATKDMNARYPDATAEELARDGTCIICREEMQPWVEPNQPPAGLQGARPRNRMLLDERQRPKKLPCGHILHFGCLRSWLERQQVCPTCRSSVLAPPQNNANTGGNFVQGAGVQPRGGAGGAPGAAQPPNPNRPVVRPNPRRARTFNLGGWRFAWAAGDEREVREALQLAQEDDNQPHPPARTSRRGHRDRANAQNNARGLIDALQALSTNHGTEAPGPAAYQRQITRLEEQIMQEINSLNLASEQLAVVRNLQQQLALLRPTPASTGAATASVAGAGQGQAGSDAQQSNTSLFAPPPFRSRSNVSTSQFGQQVLESSPEHVAIEAGHPSLPAGFTLPQGWTMLPLHSNGNTAQEVHEEDQLYQPGIETVLPQVSSGPILAQPAREAEAEPSQTTASEVAHHTSRADAESPANTIESSTSPIRSATSDVTSAPGPSSTSSINPTPSSPSLTSSTAQQDPTPSIPDWSSWASTPQASEATASSSDDTPRINGSATTNPSTVDKGKGRAVTVEDVRDEET